MSGFDEIFGSKGEVTEPAAQPEPVIEVEAPTVAEPVGETPAAPPAAEPEDLKHVPISAILDEREKRQAAQREAEELRRWKAEREAKDAEAKQPKPDFYDNPEQYLQSERQKIEHAVWSRHLDSSQYRAEQAHGKEAVAAAIPEFQVAATQNPALAHQFNSHPEPYAFLMEWKAKADAMKEIGDDPAAYRERLRQELLAEHQAAQPAQPQSRPIPGSLSAAPSAGSPNTQPTGSAFDIAFGGTR